MWRTMRLAWQPAFQSGSLEGYTDLMDDCATQLAQVRGGVGGWRLCISVGLHANRCVVRVVV